MRPDVAAKFFEHTDETGRFCITSERTGRTYAVEPQGTHQDRKWGSVHPSQKALMHKKGDGKYTGATEPEDSLITEENGFTNIQTLERGVSPHHAIYVLDAKYPDIRCPACGAEQEIVRKEGCYDDRCRYEMTLTK